MRPLAVLPVAALYGALEAGAQNMQLVTGIPGALVLVVQALPILFLVAIWGAIKPDSVRLAPLDEEELSVQGYGLEHGDSPPSRRSIRESG